MWRSNPIKNIMFVKNYTKRFDYFAYPRVGSHFFFHILSGLYELVMFETDEYKTKEYLSRKEEINSLSLYALTLRDPTKIYSQPIFINPLANGVHGNPIDSEYPIISLIRNPCSAIYSYYRLQKDRFSFKFADKSKWLEGRFEEYYCFYSDALKLKKKKKEKFLLLKYEDLIDDLGSLNMIIDFIGLETKLSPEFVFECTKFSKFTSNENRTFYREANNQKWSEDQKFLTLIQNIDLMKFRSLGYSI